jgi:hypothetical protein
MIAPVSSSGLSDPRMGRARVAVLASLATPVLVTLVLPGIGVFAEPRPVWRMLGSVGIVAVVATQAGALLAAATPGLAARTRRRLVVAFAVAAVASIPLVAPVGSAGPEGWRTWGWVGAAIVGSAPLLARPAVGTAVAVLVTAVSAGVAVWAGGSPFAYVVITAGIGVSLLAVHSLPVSLWNLVLDARAGRDAQARLAAAEERLRFARDVHDLLGHHLSVIALKAELAERLAAADPERAGREAGEVRALAAAGADTPVAVVARRVHLSQGTVRNHLAAIATKLAVPDARRGLPDGPGARLALGGPGGAEAQGAGHCVDADVAQAGRTEAVRERLRWHRHHRVADVEEPEPEREPAVRASERPARPQHPRHLREEAVLVLGRGHVVQHREADDRVEGRVRERQCGPVAGVHVHPVAEAAADAVRQVRVHLHRGEVRAPVEQPAGRDAVARADLQHVPVQRDAAARPRQHLGVHAQRPRVGPADATVQQVHRHGNDATSGSG